jgi:hypothetical protein
VLLDLHASVVLNVLCLAKFKLLEKTRQEPVDGADEGRMWREVYERHRYEDGEERGW